MNTEKMPKHIAIIMDGNRRWAREKGLDPKQGHRKGKNRSFAWNQSIGTHDEKE